MANLVGCAAMSHAPQLMLNPDSWHLLNNRQSERLPEKPGLEKETREITWSKWNGCMDAITRLRAKIDALSPDVLVIVGEHQPALFEPTQIRKSHKVSRRIKVGEGAR